MSKRKKLLPAPHSQPATPAVVLANTPQRELEPKITFRAFQGPLPDPQMLREYEDAMPGAAERIFRMTETRISHGNDCEKQDLESIVACRKEDRVERRRGQWLGYTLCAFIIACGLIAAMNGHDVFGSVLGGTTVVSIAGVFVLGRVLSSAPAKPKANEAPREKAVTR